MFKFIRRVSHSLLSRPDRPWGDDATSNPPTIGRKRRFSITERDDEADSEPVAVKKAKGEDKELDGSITPAEDGNSPVEGEDVKSVTQGVKEVDLEDQKDDSSSVRPEAVPLPESPIGTPQMESGSPEASELVEPEVEQEADDKDSVASSSGQADEDEKLEKEEDAAEPEASHDNVLAGDNIASEPNVTPADQTTSDETQETTGVKA